MGMTIDASKVVRKLQEIIDESGDSAYICVRDVLNDLMTAPIAKEKENKDEQP